MRGGWSIEVGDAATLLTELDDCSVDAVVTDPPSGTHFMGKSWDSARGGRAHWVGRGRAYRCPDQPPATTGEGPIGDTGGGETTSETTTPPT